MSTRRSIYVSDLTNFDQDYEEEFTAWTRENNMEWRNIIFLPFESTWLFVVNTSILLNALICVYYVAYTKVGSNMTKIDVVYYIFELLYLFDTFLYILHRNMTRHRIRKEYEPKSLLLLTVDVVTLLPVYEFFVLVDYASYEKHSYLTLRMLVRIKSFFRMYNVYSYLKRLQNRAGLNQLMVLGVEQAVKVVVISHILGAVWYYYGCYDCDELNWTRELSDHVFQKDNPFDWFIISYTATGGMLQHLAKGNVRGLTKTEKVIVVAILLTGYLEHIMIFFGRLNAAFLKKFRRQHSFEVRLKRIRALLQDWHVNKELKEKTLNFYNKLWSKTSGVENVPEIFQLLTSPMQKEVTLDIFWEALRHSQLFSAQDMPFKRAVSLEMKSEYYLPGDYIYTLGKVKSKMIYIVSGILQVLTEEDDESPIISFSSGTLIGETSVMLPTKSIANLRSATYSKLYTLSVKGMAKALLAFPNKRLPVKNYLDEKLRMAESLRQKRLVKENEEKDNLFIDVKGDTTIMWLKKRWRALRKIQETGSHDDQIITIPTEYYHTTKNFDMMVFGAEVELKIEAICLKGRCPFVMEPNSSFRKFWDVLTLAIVLIQSIVLPYNIAFNRTFSRKLLSWLSVLDIVYLADLYMQLSTAVTGNVIITKPIEIILYRAKRLMFLVDVFAAFPFDYIAFVYGASSHTVALFKTNRIFKIVKLLAFLQDAERNLVRNSMYVRIVKYVLIYIISTYWLSCLLFAMSCFHEECDQYGWYRYNRYLKDKQGLVIDDDRYAFTHSVFYTMGATFRLSLSNNFEYTPFDMAVFYLGVSFGNYLFAFFVSEICATFILQQQDMIKYREHIKGTQHHMTKNKIPEKLRQQVSDILQFKWQHNENTTELGTDGILQDLPEHLKEKIIWNRIKECLQNAPLFQNCDDEFVNNICAKAKLITLPEDVVICTANYKSPRMHFIIRGYCTQRSTMAGDRERRKDEILKPGDSFPIVETIHQVEVERLVVITSNKLTKYQE